MKIIVLMGSPRRKDSYNVCRQIEKETQKNNEAEFEYVYLKDYRIEDCKGCCLCFQKGESLCPCKDDIQLIKEKLINADGIIFASPVYAYQVPAPMKRVIDRLAYLFHRQELIGKPALIVVTTEGSGHRQVSKYLKMTVSGWGCNLVETINIISLMYFENREKGSVWGYREDYHKKSIEKIQASARKFMETINWKEKSTPTFYDILMFQCLRSKTLASQADYDFWEKRGWLYMDYFYEAKIGILKRGFGKILRIVIDSIGKKMLGQSEIKNF